DAHIEIVSILKKIEHQYPDFKVHITFYRCSIYEKESIKKVEHNNLSWLTKQELHELDWAKQIYLLLGYSEYNRVVDNNTNFYI
ncbi:hypothetical protein R0K30_21020, partial [Bacillus sp. SIMBA_154]